MATKSHNTTFTRLSRLGMALGIGSTHATGGSNSQEDDSYIPYNGPYEPPIRGREIRGYWDSGVEDTTIGARSFSQLSLGGGRTRGSSPKSRRYSDASRLTLSNVMTEPRRKLGRIRKNSTPRKSYVSLDQGGGVGDTPVPAHRATPGHSRSSSKRRDSIFRASMTDLRKSFSKGSTRHGKARSSGASSDNPGLAASPFVYAQGSHRPRSNSAAVPQQHPYAAASLYLGKMPARANLHGQNHNHTKSSPKKIPTHLKPSSRASLLRASLSTPDLRSASRQPALYIKAKTNWLSAETWCDAFMFPRPRFLLRHLEEDLPTPKRRLVSPTESIVSVQMETSVEPKPLKKSLSVSELRAPRHLQVVPRRADKSGAPQSSSAPRPKSFALDDLALPSPMPSLMTVLAERQNLQNERQMWQERATRSFGNKRTRSLSRSRSLGKTRKPSYRQPPGTFDFLVERTLLGNQAVPSTIHTTTNPPVIPMHAGATNHPLASTFPRLRSKSHGHSRSVGAIHDSSGRRRRGSFSTVLHCAASATTGLCPGADETPTPPDALDAFTEKEGSGAVTLLERQRRATSPQSVISISANRTRQFPDRSFHVPSYQRSGVSPTPGGIEPAEVVGIAISSPLPPEEPLDDGLTTSSTPLYVWGENSRHHTPVNSILRSEAMHHRQPIVHPYAIHSAHPGVLSSQWTNRDQVVSPARRMFAEVAPGRLREIHPEEIQYSPYIDDVPRVFATTRATHRPGAVEGPSFATSRRDSDVLRLGDALTFALTRHRRSPSTDSGIGTSEDPHPYGPQLERTMSSRSNTFPLPQVNEVVDAVDENGDEGTSDSRWLEPSATIPRTHSNNSDPSSLRTASSGRIDPSVFTGPPTPMRRMESSGSSPGLSNDSSPPLTPRPMGRLDDLERFQDLFYNPSANQPESPPAPVQAAEPVAWRSPVSSVSLARNRSRLTTLVRQLSEDLNELRNEERIAEGGNQSEGTYDDESGDPITSAAFAGRSSWSDGSSSILGSNQLFLSTLPPLHPIEQSTVPLRENFPEDVESEASSLSDRILEEDYHEITETLRLGNVEAVSTPPPVNTPRRESGHVALVNDTTDSAIPSSSLTIPSTGLTRSSHLTIDSSGSRISGLSAFPQPPSGQSADILASYFVEERDDDDMPELISAAFQSPVSPTGENQEEWAHAV